MKKIIFIMMVTCSLLTSCKSSQKAKEASDNEPVIHVVEIYRYPDNYNVALGNRTPGSWFYLHAYRILPDILFIEYTPEGDAVFSLNNTASLSNDGIITVATSRLEDFEIIVPQIKSILNNATEQGKTIKSITFSNDGKTIVKYEN